MLGERERERYRECLKKSQEESDSESTGPAK